MDFEQRSDTRWVGLTRQGINADTVSAFLTDEVSGGVCVFSGNTRGVTGNVVTVRLEYDCYPEMAVKVMSRIVDEALLSFSINRAVIIHRLGEVPPGDASVIVASSAAHRDASFNASRFLIDELKKHVPIWKKEYFSDGSSEWVGVE
ncbi:MAG: molybdenum cofactor biosynthesis protein MoaE [Rhodothermales bacterium]|nr:molybdenum cofactor biosynthesis protein MoaE [Rhodothermales bacterium]